MKTILSTLATGLFCVSLAFAQQTGTQFTLPGANSQNNQASQTQSSKYWKDIDPAKIPVSGTQYITPTQARPMYLNFTTLQSALAQAPAEFSNAAQTSNVTIDLPLPDGSMETFRVVNSPIMEKELQDKYPEIQTYRGISTSGTGNVVRFDMTPQGFHAMILRNEAPTIFIDPYYFGGGDVNHYTVYERTDFVSSVQKLMDCDVLGSTSTISSNSGNKTSFASCELREYRLALACTGEYAQFHGGTVALAQAAQVTTMNRVNGVYERDIAVRMNIIGNNNLLIYTNSGSDPYTNNSGGAMLGENQTNVDAVIGSANYDIGHVFSTGGGGIAGLGVVCSGGNKARGVTGSPAPVGDPFDIDYVCHEMGHQFGANHTQNNNCNRNNATAMEPGSASTIMGYAGICAPNVQNNSDDHFHGISLEEIGNEISTHFCPTTTALANTAPTITGTNGNMTIPASTPFALTATATDPDGNTLTYNWEQMNNNVSTQPPVSTSTGGPNFRSYSSSTDPTRYFPNLTDLSAGGPFTWEVLSSVSRTMDFRCTVRDNASGAGCADYTDITVTVDGGSGPFVVTYPTATGITWTGLTSETVTWNVAGTDQSPVSCANVDILLSTDGGLTYPTVLATNVPNDGSQVVTVPNTATTTARVMVICSSGTFFDISDNNFTITAATNDYTLTTANASVSVCAPTDAVYTIDVGQVGGYSDPVTLSISGVPAGATSAFGTNPVTPAGQSTLTISNTGAATPGSYTLTITANSTSGTKTLDLTLNISSSSPSAITLATPADGSNGVSTTPTLTWNASADPGVTYEIEVATDAAFTNIVDQATGIVGTSYAPTGLTSSTTYYWRVRVTTGCGSSPWSTAFSFTTSNCNIFTSTNVPVAISASGTPTITSTLTIGAVGTIQDVNVTQLSGTHTYISDLTVTLTSPTGTVVTLFDQVCANEDDFDVTFDDAATPGALPCPPVGGGLYQPNTVLSAFNGESPTGTWTLTIADAFNQDGGSLDAWAIELCIAAPVSDDAGVSAIITPGTTVCENPFTPEVEITNFGTSTLTSATINYQVDGGPIQTQPWTGSLAQGATENVVLPAITSGTVGTPVIFTAYTTLPNGVADANNLNDTSSVTTTVSQPMALPYSEDFEAGAMPTNITIINPNSDAGVWEHTTTASGFGTGAGSARVDNFSNNTTGTLDWMILPTLDFTGASNTFMTFDVAYVRYGASNSDTLVVAVNDDCGTLYTPEYYEGGTNLATAPDQTSAFIPTAVEWRTDTVDLSAYDGTAAVKIAFINLGDYGNILYVDNINIQTTLPPVLGTDTQTACNSFTWIDGNTYTADNNTATYTIPGGASNGADSIVTLDLTVNYSNTGTDVQTSCGPYTWIDGNTYTANNNSATYTLTNAAGCDSVVTLDLTVNNPSATTDVQSSCGPYTWIDGNTYTSSNNSATVTLTNTQGCDSVITLDLTVNTPTTGTDVQTACVSYTWIDGNTYTSSNNTATWTLTNAAGCDSVVTLDLTVGGVVYSTDTQSACESFTWVDGNTYTSSNNTATYTTTATGGCDSVVTLDLTILNPTTGTDTQVACDSYTWIDGNTYTSSNNSATFTLTNAQGCDSLVTLDLTIETIDNSATQTSYNTLEANQTGASYQWIDCDNGNATIAGATGQTYTATTNGNYAVLVTSGSCTDTSACLNINSIGLAEINGLDFMIYPNPTNGELTVDFAGSSTSTFELYDATGRVVMTGRLETGKNTVSVAHLATGSYTFAIKGMPGVQSIVKL